MDTYMTHKQGNTVDGIFRVREEVEEPNGVEVLPVPGLAAVPGAQVEKQETRRQENCLK